MASLRSYKVAKGLNYRVTEDLGEDANGKRIQESRSFQKLKDARAYKAKVELRENRGVADPHKFTVAAYLLYWLSNHPRELSPSTLDGYQRLVEMIVRYIGKGRLTELTARPIDSMLKEALASGGKGPGGIPRPLTAQTVLHMLRVLHTALQQAVKWQLIAFNPASQATPPKVPKSKVRAHVDGEWPRIQAAAETAQYPYMSVLVTTLAITGVRRGEIVATKWDCVDLERATVEVRRTIVTGPGGKPVLRECAKTVDSVRAITIPPMLCDMLRRHRAVLAEHALAYGPDYQRLGFVFPEADGLPMSPESLSSKMRSLMKRAGVKGAQPCHSFRHSMATRAFAAGADLVTVSKRLGHSKPSTTSDIYLHTDDKRDREAADTIAKALGL